MRKPGNIQDDVPAPSVGRVHEDGSVTFRGVRYGTLKEVPPGCRILRADLAAETQWRRLYRALEPARRKKKR